MGGKLKKPIFKRWWFWAILIVIAIGFLGSGGDKSEGDKSDQNDKPAIAEGNGEIELSYNITGELDIKFEDGKAIAAITTNAADGSLFETTLMDGQLNLVSDFISIESGKGIKEFEIPEEWEVGYISGLAMMRFNLDEHPQPDSIKELYGENGEKLEGEFAKENNLGGYNINLEVGTVPYPDEKTVREKLDELFLGALNELISASDGVIVKIQPHFTDGDWSSVAVTVSDAWYYSQEHEKERFAEQVGDTVTAVIKNAAKVDGDKMVSVYFYDTYEKELASPKIMGGYKIKR